MKSVFFPMFFESTLSTDQEEGTPVIENPVQVNLPTSLYERIRKANDNRERISKTTSLLLFVTVSSTFID